MICLYQYESQLQNTRRQLEESEMNKNLLTQQVNIRVIYRENR